MKIDEIAWFAGFYEGEGNVRLGSRHVKNGRLYGCPVVDICQVNKEPLEKLEILVPGSKIYGPYKYNKRQQPHFKWLVSGVDKVSKIYQLLGPYLSNRRQLQFERTLQEYAKLIDRPSLPRGHRKPGIPTMAVCHPTKRLKAKGLCEACYQRSRKIHKNGN